MADLIINYKGQPIVEMTESGTKTLKTAGKYCEDDITVEYAKPAGGGGGFAETIVTDVMENHIVSSSWSPSVTAVEYIPKMYYYNDVLLPELPADVLASYPYAWIRNNTRTGYYDLLLSQEPWYLQDENTLAKSVKATKWYQISIASADTAEAWTFNSDYDSLTWGNESDRQIMWSNHDIPNGSATATEIYFEGSEPVLAE